MNTFYNFLGAFALHFAGFFLLLIILRRVVSKRSVRFKKILFNFMMLFWLVSLIIVLSFVWN